MLKPFLAQSTQRCLICTQWDSAFSIPLCKSCVRSIKLALRPKSTHIPESGFFEIISLFEYSPSVSQLIRRLKFQPTLNRDTTALLNSVAEYLDPSALTQCDLICPIPSSSLRCLQQSDLGFAFASSIAIAHNRILAPTALLKHSKIFNPQQKFKSHQARLKRAHPSQQSFKVCADLPQKDILLIDDVCTTGATLLASKAAFEASGYSVKRAVVLASRF